MNLPNTLRYYFPDYLNVNSLFTKMSTLGAPWSSDVGQDMDDAYFTMWSGIKNPSEFVRLHLNPDEETANSLTIARILYGIYGQNWTKIWEAMQAKYNPIDNYSMKELVTTTNSNDRTVNKTNDLTSTVDTTSTQDTTKDNTSTEDTTQNGSENMTGSTTTDTTSDSNGTSSLEHGETITRSANSDSYIYAFNSTEKVPTASQVESGSDTHSGTDTTMTTDHSTVNVDGTSKSDTTTSNTVKVEFTGDEVGKTTTSENSARADKGTEDVTDSSTGKEDIERTRSGNIGVTTTQQMLQQEFELWKWNFFAQVFEDCDKYLCLSVCSTCTH